MWPFYLFFPLSIFNWSIIVLQYCVCFCHTSTWINHRYKKLLLLGRKAMANLDSILKSRDINLPTGPYCQSYGFSSSHVQMWELDHKEGWAPKNWCFRTVVLEKTLESRLDCKEIKPVTPKGNQSWIFIGRTDAGKLKLQYFGHLIQRTDSFEKILMLGKIEGRRRGNNRGWDGWMASLTQWTWAWVNSGSWWWTGRPGVLQSMRLQSQTWLSGWTDKWERKDLD